MRGCCRFARNLILIFAHWISLSTRLKILNSMQLYKALLMRALCPSILFLVSRLALFSRRSLNTMVYVICLSVEDISVMVYAIDNDCRLLTGDKKLKDKATLENVKVSGILFLTDMLTREAAIGCGGMIYALERLLSSNSRLPKKLIKERIDALKRLNSL